MPGGSSGRGSLTGYAASSAAKKDMMVY